jgi:hypothetical protein
MAQCLLVRYVSQVKRLMRQQQQQQGLNLGGSSSSRGIERLSCEACSGSCSSVRGLLVRYVSQVRRFRVLLDDNAAADG